MLLSFLRFFQIFRDLEVEIENLRESLNVSEMRVLSQKDQLDSAANDREQLWRLVGKSMESRDEAVANERAAYQMHINMSQQGKGMPAPYPEAYTLPDNNPGGGSVGRRGRTLMSQAVNEEARKRIEELVQSHRPKTAEMVED